MPSAGQNRSIFFHSMASQPSCMCLRRAGHAVFNVNAYVQDLESAIGTLTGPSIQDEHGQATCILIYKDWLLTTHSTLPHAGPAFDCEVSFKHNGIIISRKLNPRKFFVTDKELDLTLVTCEDLPSDLTPLRMDTSRAYGASYGSGHKVYILGHSRMDEQNDPVTVGKGKVVSPHSDQKVITVLLKEQNFYVQGSAGFDSWGNFAFIICSPQGWLPKKSKAKKKRFSLMSKSRREKSTQTGLTIHSIKEWIEKVLSERLQGLNDEDSSTAGPRGIAQDLQGLRDLLHAL